MSTIKRFKKWILSHQDDILIFLIIVLVALLSFAIGYLSARFQEKEPLRFGLSAENFDPRA
jgi:predicted Na+-dependent transporter